MAITPEQRQRRREHIGSSDAAQIMQVSEWGTPLDVFVEKVSELCEEGDNAAFRTGNLMEPAIGQFVREELGLELEPSVVVNPNDGTPFESNTDFMTPDREIVVETKFVNHERFIKHYGVPGTDLIPADVLIQIQTQMLCCPTIKRGIHAIATPTKFGLEWLLYEVPRSEPLIAEIRTQCLAFWKNHVLQQVPPTGIWAPNLDSLKRLARYEKEVEVSIGDVLTWGAYREMRLAFEKAEKAAAARLVASLGDGDKGSVAGIEERIGCHYAIVNATDIDRDKMRADGILDKYQKPKSYRRLSPILPRKTSALELIELFEVADGARLIERALTTKEQSGE
jgi:predicted phage-related endonuclease